MGCVVVVIQAGGDGTRLWPLSTIKRPKQFLKIGKHSFFQQTVRRAQGLREKLDVRFVVLGNSHTTELLLKQCQEIDFVPDDILIQPCNRNTAPALIAVAAYVRVKYGEEIPTCFLPCDHVFGSDVAVCRNLIEALHLVPKKAFVSLVTKAGEYNRQYGYYFGCAEASEAFFIARPSFEILDEMKEKNFHPFWDCGVFVTTPEFLLDRAEESDEAFTQGCTNAAEKFSKSGSVLTFNATLYEALPSVPITTLVMQKLKKIGIVPLSTTWTDIGSWRSFLCWYFKGGWKG